jgi:hypothetical protein
VKVVVDGRTFASKKEARTYLRLKAEQLAGRVSGLRCQVSFPLRVGGVLVCRYVADFVLVRDGRREVIDAKGMRTDVFVLKKRLMLAVHGIDVTEV